MGGRERQSFFLVRRVQIDAADSEKRSKTQKK